MADIESIRDLVNAEFARLLAFRSRYKQSYSYYDASYRPEAIGLSVPPQMQALTASVGWARMYVDSIEERLDVEGFRLGDNKELSDKLLRWWQTNNLDEESSMGHTDALICSRSYVTVSAPGPLDPPDTPVIRVESAHSMIHSFDPRTRKIEHMIRFYKNPLGVENRATLMLPNETLFLDSSAGQWTITGSIEHKLNEVPGKVLVNRARLSEPDGKSEIFRELRSHIDAASRILMNMQAAAELMAVPQRILFGVEADDLVEDPENPGQVMEAYLARILAFGESEGKAFQFSAAELRNYTEALDKLSKDVASYTGLPPQYLAYNTDNPASADAIRSSESRLVKKVERKSRMFGGTWEEVMRLAVKVMDGKVDPELFRLETVWRDPSTPTYAAKADAAIKLYNNGQGVIPREQAQIDIGYSEPERTRMKQMFDSEPVNQLAKVLGNGPTGARRPSSGE